MKKKLLLVVVLIVLAFLPPLLGTSLGSTGTGIFPLDFMLFAVLPMIVIAFLLHFLFKLPSEMPTTETVEPAVTSSKEEETAEEEKPAKAEKAAAKAAKAAEKEKAAKAAAKKARKEKAAKAAAKAAKAAEKEKAAAKTTKAEKIEKAPKAPKPAKASAIAPSKELPEEEVKLEDLSASEPVITGEPEVTCPECGGKVTMYDPTCPHCGVKFESDDTEEIIKEEQPFEEPAADEVLPFEEPPTEAPPLEIPEEPKAAMNAFGLKCPTCGGNIGLEEKFCPHCGADFEAKELEPDSSGEKSEEELDKLFGIAPEESKPEDEVENKPISKGSDEIVISYDEPEEKIIPVKSKKGKKKK